MKRLHLVLLVLASAVLVVAAAVAAFYGMENRRGAQDWERVQRELAAQGESLAAASFIPLQVPDERNLALIPLFARALDYRADSKTGELTFGQVRLDETEFRDMPYGHGEQKPQGSPPGGWEAGQHLTLDGVQRFYAQQKDFPHPPQPGAPSADVLLALTKFSHALEEIDAAVAARPQTRFPVRWTQWPPSEIALPQDNLIQKLVSVLRLRALANLDAGRHAEAMRDLVTAFRVRDSIRPEPTLIAHLVVITCDGMLLQPIWEGLASRRWTADELRELQRELRNDDLLADYVWALRGERAIFFCQLLDGLRRSGATRGLDPVRGHDAGEEERKMYRQIAAFYPRGWIDRSEANICLAYQEIITRIVDLPVRRVSAGRAKEWRQQWDRKGNWFAPWEAMLKLSLPLLESVLSRTTWAQTTCEQAEVACALERYFLVNGAYPPTLETLTPGFIDRIPNDLIADGPMRYRRTDDGRYLLYGVGWNERDDGGRVEWTHLSSGSVSVKPDHDQGDWVWQYQPISPPAR